MSSKNLTTPTTTDNSLSPSTKLCRNTNFCLISKGIYLKQRNTSFAAPNPFIVNELDTCSRDLNSNFTLKDCLFGGVKLARNDHSNKYVYTGYCIGFDSCQEFS